ncbi:MAG: hypothetical protein A3Q59_01505 [Methanomethylophilus alvi]|nr:MAG: hypothetical protein A3Q59_01505 [Methanomethylophilus alvi]
MMLPVDLGPEQSVDIGERFQVLGVEVAAGEQQVGLRGLGPAVKGDRLIDARFGAEPRQMCQRIG